MKRTLFFLTSLCALTLSACGGDETATGTAGPSTGGGGAGAGGSGGGGGTVSIPTVDLAWSPCPLYSDGAGPEAECASPQVPLYAADPGGKTISYHLKRYAKPSSSRKTQLWMLAGGPGFSGIIYEQRAEQLALEDDSLEIYIPDHRGTGDSTRLGCPVQEGDSSAWGFFIAPGEWPQCAQAMKDEWGEDLGAFNVTQAANDLGVLIESARQEGARVFVYGASYGTYWGHRYMQLFPSQADGVILDAIAPPGTSLARQDKDADDASFDLFQACADDPACGPRLGGDPRAFALALYDELDAGHCPGIQQHGPGRVLLRRSFGQMMMGWNARRLIPAALARAKRCNDDDVAALGTLFDFHFAPDPASEIVLREYSFPLAYHISFSELWEQPEVTIDQMAAWREAAVVSRDITENLAAALPAIPRYAPDEHHLAFADTDVPLLMLQGTWDPATRPGPAAALKEAYKGAHQRWVEIAQGTHGALQSVPTKDGASCGTAIVMSFLRDPQAPPDTSCLSDVAPLSFDGSPALNLLLFGVEDAWGGL